MKLKLTLIALLALLVQSAWAFEYQGLKYEVLDEEAKTAKVSENSDVSGDIVIPEKVECDGNTYTVTEIGNSAFKDCSGLTSVTIPNSVTEIGDNAFKGCSGLETVNFNAENCTSCGDFMSSVFPSTIKVLNIGRSVKQIPHHAFNYCRGLTEVTIPDSVTEIGYGAFKDCSGLETVNFNAENCTSCGDYGYPAFPSTIKFLNIGEGVKQIPESAFSDCSGLTSVVIPNSVATIGNRAFDYCSGLKTVIIGTSVAWIGKSAFAGCFGLIKSAYPGSIANPFNYGIGVQYPVEVAVVEDGCVWGPEKSAIYFVPTTIEGDFTIPSTVTSIGENAFSGCSGLTKITSLNEIPPTIAYDAFEGLYSSVTLVVPNSSLQAYLNSPFSQFENMQGTDGTVFASFNDDVFKYRIISDNSVSLIKGDYASMTSVSIPDRVVYDDKFYNVASIAYEAFKGCSSVKKLVLPVSLEWIGDDAFSGCEGITEVSLPSTLKWLGKRAFNGCALTNLLLPPAVQTIGESAFAGCDLKKIVIGAKVTEIGEKAFDGANSLESVSITALTPPQANNNTFSYYNCPLYLANDEAVDAYYNCVRCWYRFSGYKMVVADDLKIAGPDSISLSRGQAVRLTATLSPANASLPYVFWRSTNRDVAVVDSYGVVNYVAATEGEGCDIIAETLYADGPVAKVSINGGSAPVAPVSVTLSQTTASLKVGESVTLSATVLPEDASDKTVAWSSSNAAVATVDANGKVTAVAAGDATITASCGNVSATCAVTVLEDTTGIEGLEADAQLGDIYTMQGVCVKRNATAADVKALTPGLYIVGGKKVLIR